MLAPCSVTTEPIFALVLDGTLMLPAFDSAIAPSADKVALPDMLIMPPSLLLIAAAPLPNEFQPLRYHLPVAALVKLPFAANVTLPKIEPLFVTEPLPELKAITILLVVCPTL